MDRIENSHSSGDEKMRLIREMFVQHPASVGESYTEHMGMAFSFGARMITAGAACLLHGLIPALFTRTGSAAIDELHTKMVTNRVRTISPSRETDLSDVPTVAADRHQSSVA